MFVYTTPKRNFTIIPNEVIDNDNLSIQAIAIYTKLRRNCNEWKFSAKAMAKKCGLNIKTFYKYLNELYKEGLIKRVQKQENGRFTNEVAYIFVKDFNDFEAEIQVDELENEQVKTLEKSLHKHFSQNMSDESFIVVDEESAKSNKKTSQNIVSPKITEYNNIIDSNKTKESEQVAKRTYAILDLNKLWNECMITLNKAKEARKSSKAKEKNELFAFTSQLNQMEEQAYLNYIEYRSEKKKLSKHTLKRIQAKFMQLKHRGFDMFAIVENTIAKGWTDLYPMQTKQQRKHEERVKESSEYVSFRERYKDFDEEKELAKLLAL